MPGNRDLYSAAMNTADRYRWESQWQNAIGEYQTALSEFPEDITARSGLGFCYMQCKRWQQALNEYEYVIQRDAKNVIALSKIAELYGILNRHPEAYQAYLQMADLYMQSGQSARSEAAWQKSLQISPGTPEPHERLAHYYFEKKDIPAMIRHQLAAARGYLRKNDPGAARHFCEAVLRADTRNQQAQELLKEIMYGASLMAPPKNVGAIPTPESSASDTSAPQSHSGPFVIQTGSSLDQTMTSGNLSGGNTGIMGNMGSAGQYSGVNNPGSALANNGAPNGSNPSSRKRITASQVTGVLKQAQTFQAQGRFNEAIDLCEQILESGFDRPDARYFLGWLYQEQQRWDEAIHQFQLLLNDPDYALSCYYALGQCYRARGDLRTATVHFDEAVDRVNLDALTIEESDQLVQLCQEAAEAHRMMGEQDQAMTVYNALLGFLRSRNWSDKVNQVEAMLQQAQSAPAPSLPTPPAPQTPPQPAMTQPPSAYVPDMTAIIPPQQQNYQQPPQPSSYQQQPSQAPSAPIAPASNNGELPDWLTGMLGDPDKTQLSPQKANTQSPVQPFEAVSPPSPRVPSAPLEPPMQQVSSPSWLTEDSRSAAAAPPPAANPMGQPSQVLTPEQHAALAQIQAQLQAAEQYGNHVPSSPLDSLASFPSPSAPLPPAAQSQQQAQDPFLTVPVQPQNQDPFLNASMAQQQQVQDPFLNAPMPPQPQSQDLFLNTPTSPHQQAQQQVQDSFLSNSAPLPPQQQVQDSFLSNSAPLPPQQQVQDPFSSASSYQQQVQKDSFSSKSAPLPPQQQVQQDSFLSGPLSPQQQVQDSFLSNSAPLPPQQQVQGSFSSATSYPQQPVQDPFLNAPVVPQQHYDPFAMATYTTPATPPAPPAQKVAGSRPALEDLLSLITGGQPTTGALNEANEAILRSTNHLNDPTRSQVIRAMQDIQKYIAHGLLTSATEECLRVIDMAPQYLDVHQVLCEIYVRQGKTEQAITKYGILVDTYIVNGRIDDAIATYRRILQLEPNNITYRMRLINLLSSQGSKEDLLRERTLAAESYLRLGYIDRALTELEQALQESPTSVSTRLNYALALSKLGRVQQAVAEYQRVLQVDPRNITALIRWHTAMVTTIDTSLSTSLEVLSRIRWQLRGEGQRLSDTVIQEYLQVVDIYPNNADLHFAIGQIYHQSGQFDRALDSYLLAMRDNSVEVMARVSASQSLMAQGKPEAAIQQLENALQNVRRSPTSIDPTVWAARPREEGEEHKAPEVEISLQLAKAYARIGRQDQADSLLRQIKQTKPVQNEVSSAIAEISSRRGDVSGAMQEYIDLVRHYRNNRQVDNALSVLNEMVQLAPQDPRPHDELADLYINRGMLEEGMAELRMISDIYLRRNQLEEAASALQRIGSIFADMGNPEEALSNLCRAVDLNPESTDTLREVVGYSLQLGRQQEAVKYQTIIARYYFDTHQVKEAVAALQQLITIDRSNFDAYDMLGQTYQSVGEYEQASRVYRNLAKVHPGSPTARERLATLQELRSQ